MPTVDNLFEQSEKEILRCLLKRTAILLVSKWDIIGDTWIVSVNSRRFGTVWAQHLVRSVAIIVKEVGVNRDFMARCFSFFPSFFPSAGQCGIGGWDWK
jgi:hypothetical protein